MRRLGVEKSTRLGLASPIGVLLEELKYPKKPAGALVIAAAFFSVAIHEVVNTI